MSLNLSVFSETLLTEKYVTAAISKTFEDVSQPINKQWTPKRTQQFICTDNLATKVSTVHKHYVGPGLAEY